MSLKATDFLLKQFLAAAREKACLREKDLAALATVVFSRSHLQAAERPEAKPFTVADKEDDNLSQKRWFLARLG